MTSLLMKCFFLLLVLAANKPNHFFRQFFQSALYTISFAAKIMVWWVPAV